MILPYKGKRDLLINGRHRKNYGDAPWAAARQGWADAPAADVKVMEMHRWPRPVKGGPGLMGVNIWVQTKSHGGSRGPADPWSASTASKRWDLWFFRSRKNNDNSRRCQKEGHKAILASKLQGNPR